MPRYYEGPANSLHRALGAYIVNHTKKGSKYTPLIVFMEPVWPVVMLCVKVQVHEKYSRRTRVSQAFNVTVH